MSGFVPAEAENRENRPVDLVIFDCDGVLVDSEWLEGQLLTEYLNSHGVSITLEETICRFAGRQQVDIASTIERELGIELEPKFWSDFMGGLEEAFQQRLEPIAGITEVLRKLELPFCVASNTPRDRLILKLRTANLLPLTNTRFISAQDVFEPKPAPHLFLFAAELMGVKPENCLVVEDSVSGLKAANAADMRAVEFLGGRHCTPDYVAKLTGIPAFATAWNSSELLGILNGQIAGEVK